MLKVALLCAVQLLRQVLDEHVLFNTKRPFDRRLLEGVVVTTAMSLQAGPVTSGLSQRIPERLKVMNSHSSQRHWKVAVVHNVTDLLSWNARKPLNGRVSDEWLFVTCRMVFIFIPNSNLNFV